MTENPGSDGPLSLPWQQLAAKLRTQIEDGDLKPGEPVPSISELVRGGHANARATCAKALMTLASSGLIVRRPGRGYYAAGGPEGA
jgi:DNA-binding GntR family transcriptional regulator